jgi:tetratricopeptide (TPR) repeat protein
MTIRRFSRAAGISIVIALTPPGLHAADQWIEVKSPHFLVTSNAGQTSARSVAWQLEQIRSAISVWWPWARVDLNKPLAVVAVKDETTMKALVPQFWEQKASVHPDTVWVTGPDQHYMIIRTDVQAQDRVYLNPYLTSYFSYVSLILQQSVNRELPPWFFRGLAGVMSNTLVRSDEILVGPVIPWHLEELRNHPHLHLAALIKVTGDSPELRTEDGMTRFDAISWAFVHFLLFGDKGAHADKLERFAVLVANGKNPDVAFQETLGRADDFEEPLGTYVSRNLFSFNRLKIDTSTKREGYTVRSLPPAEVSAGRALVHAALGRSMEARGAIAEARKAAADAPESFVAEGMLLDREGKREEAIAAFTRAIDGGSASAYAPYRLAMLLWPSQLDRDTFTRMEKLLGQAMAANSRNANASAALGEVRGILGSGDPLPLVLRAITLEPAEASHRLTAARVLLRLQKYDDALKVARIAEGLARTDEVRRQVTEMIGSIEEAKRRAGGLD